MRIAPVLLAALAALAGGAFAATGCSRAAPRAEAASSASLSSDALAQVPDGYGRPYESGAALVTVAERQLVLPGGLRCSPPRLAGLEPGAAMAAANAPARCDEAVVAKLRREALAIEIDRRTAMGELSQAFATLGSILREGETACLVVRDGAQRRCIPFRPFAAGDFSAWLDAPRPLGKIRVVFRADGMEVVADRGKVPGPDRFGPSLPPVDGAPDFAGLDRIMRVMASRFSGEEEAVLAPSAGLRIEQVARALALMNGPSGERFERMGLVYP